MAKNFRNYDKEEKSGEIKKLKGIIKKLEHEITRLKSELKTYNRAFEKNIEFLKKGTNDLSLEELIEGAKNDLNLKEIKEDKKYTMAELTAKWMCYRDWETDRKSTRLNSSHSAKSRMPSSA